MFELIVDELDRSMPNAERASIPDASHEMQADDPSAFNEMVLSFSSRHAA